jgi:transcriptional regulator with XRE-family HTH domain
MKTLRQLVGWKRGKPHKGAISALALKMGVSFQTVRDWLHGSRMTVASTAFIEQLWKDGGVLELKPLGRPSEKIAKKERIVLTRGQRAAF